MSKFSFSSSPILDEGRIIQSELQLRFDNIATRVNTDKFDIEQYRKGSVRYRHLQKPGIIFLKDRKVGSAIFNGVLNKAGVINWTQVRVFHTAGINSAPAGGRLNMPPYAVYATYRATRWEESAYEILIGYSTDGGATFAEFPNSARWLGCGHANTQVLWTAMTTHPYTGIAGTYWPPSMYKKKLARTQVAVMDMSAIYAGINPTNIDAFAIGIRCNGAGSPGTGTRDVHALDVATLRLVGRENTF